RARSDLPRARRARRVAGDRRRTGAAAEPLLAAPLAAHRPARRARRRRARDPRRAAGRDRPPRPPRRSRGPGPIRGPLLARDRRRLDALLPARPSLLSPDIAAPRVSEGDTWGQRAAPSEAARASDERLRTPGGAVPSLLLER